jgi:hypothetical protein
MSKYYNQRRGGFRGGRTLGKQLEDGDKRYCVWCKYFVEKQARQKTGNQAKKHNFEAHFCKNFCLNFRSLPER